jgi:Bacterial Ig-like domain
MPERLLPSDQRSWLHEERSREESITFKLFKKGTTTKVGAAVGYDASAARASLDPTNPLKSGVTYKAIVTTGAKDLAGNALGQNPTKAGNQPKVWSFTVRP